MRICHSTDDLTEVFPNTINVIFSILGHASIGSGHRQFTSISCDSLLGDKNVVVLPSKTSCSTKAPQYTAIREEIFIARLISRELFRASKRSSPLKSRSTSS